MVAGDDGKVWSKDFPLSQHIPTKGSSGMLPRKGTCMSFATPNTPPGTGGKILESLLHFGHTKALMFSIMPIIETPTFLQKFISFRTSNNATS